MTACFPPELPPDAELLLAEMSYELIPAVDPAENPTDSAPFS